MTGSRSTVKPGLPRKRGKRVVENYEYAKFTRRVLKAYSRRVADGDVEFLRCLVSLTCDVEQATRDAVRGLRAFGYSWSEIAARLGVSRQAAQMRYGDRAERGALDKRLLEAGLGVTLATLVKVFADHFPGWPLPDTCPGCGYPYPTDAASADCPSLAVARQLLYRRRNEDERVLRRLPADMYADLYDRKTVRAQPKRQPAWPPRPRDERASWEPAGALVPISNPNGSSGRQHA
jgi:hypothetical protein